MTETQAQPELGLKIETEPPTEGQPEQALDVLVDDRYDQRIRWRPGERLDHLFEARCDELRAAGAGDRLAVDAASAALTYDELDGRANQLARCLAGRGVRAGDRIGLLFEDPVAGYVGMLAVLKLNAAYVPLDAGYPADRLAFIVADAAVRVVLTHTSLASALRTAGCAVWCLDDLAAAIEAEDAGRLAPDEKRPPVDELCYVIYTSGSTGRPKGVAIEHASICNFVRVAAELYGVTGDDRVYQGMTIAFDFSVEEIWVPWLAGATLVPKPAGEVLLGHDLREFLLASRVTAICGVPTLLATIEDDVPDLRFVLLSGEACPQDLVQRWHRPDRRLLNVYGPTEATVTATWTELVPGRRVTIGRPLPTYRIVLLEPGGLGPVRRGVAGEICIAGPGLARGYLNRPDATASAFIDEVPALPGNPSGRLYRTGDLGRIDEHGQIEYLGRIDSQVKIRGYRIELTEIESVLLQAPGVATAVVQPVELEPGVVELAAYYCRRSDAPAAPEELLEHLRCRLPGYMVPAYLEELAALPLLPSDKVDRASLPLPSRRSRLGSGGAQVKPEGPTEVALAEALAQALGVDQVSAQAHFFDDLGASSLVLARFCARAREHPGLAAAAAPSMKDVYLNPSVQRLAAALDGVSAPTPGTAGSVDGLPGAGVPASVDAARAERPASRRRYVGCGLAQAALMLGYGYLLSAIGLAALRWISSSGGLGLAYLRSLAMVGVSFFGLLALPVLAKWLLIGRWRPREIPLWGAAYFRFWAVQTLIRLSPAPLLAGSPLYGFFLRALGARIGPGALILSRSVPLCTDLLTIGAGAVIRKDSKFAGYRAQGGVIRTGRVTVGAGAFVGEAAVLDIDTEVGAGAQLGHASALLPGQRIPDGARWHGSPAQPATVDYQRCPALPASRARAVLYGLSQLLSRLVVTGPLLLGLGLALLALLPGARMLIHGGRTVAHSGPWEYLPLLAVVAAVVVVGGALVGLAVTLTLPRLLNLALTPGRVYPVYGTRYAVQRAVARLTNVPFFHYLFGDSSYITGYLGALGYRLRPVQQTGSNFGIAIKHENPYLVSVGTGTMVSDGLSLMNAEFTGTSFRVAPTAVGARSYLGNGIAFPAGARVGENCLLATKVLLPLDGPVRQGVGLLGSPSFEIPRAVQRGEVPSRPRTPQEQATRLAAKNRHNLATMGLFVLMTWFLMLVIGFAVEAAATDSRLGRGPWTAALVFPLLPLLTAGLLITVERATVGFRRLRPRTCSIYDRAFWRHERYWKLSSGGYLALFNGTPMKSWAWRALGARVGAMLYDDGCGITEKSLVVLGDRCTLNHGSALQSHSLEEGVFTSEHIVLEDGATLGVGAFVHYGVRVGAGAALGADSFLMKGEQVPAGQQWQGNPARPG